MIADMNGLDPLLEYQYQTKRKFCPKSDIQAVDQAKALSLETVNL